MLEEITRAHFTVPHSGTRYINQAIQNCTGEKEIQLPGRKNYDRAKDRGPLPSTLFCHIGDRYKEWIKQIAEQEHIKSWVTVRSPILTWCTHWGFLEGNLHRPVKVYEKLGNMRQQYESLIELVPNHIEKVYRVDMDPIEDLGDYLGLELQAHKEFFSRPSEMKQAVANRDIEKMEWLCRGTEFWRAFHDYTTPNMAEFFSDLGYDIWWYDGKRNAA